MAESGRARDVAVRCAMWCVGVATSAIAAWPLWGESVEGLVVRSVAIAVEVPGCVGAGGRIDCVTRCVDADRGGPAGGARVRVTLMHAGNEVASVAGVANWAGRVSLGIQVPAAVKDAVLVVVDARVRCEWGDSDRLSVVVMVSKAGDGQKGLQSASRIEWKTKQRMGSRRRRYVEGPIEASVGVAVVALLVLAVVVVTRVVGVSEGRTLPKGRCAWQLSRPTVVAGGAGVACALLAVRMNHEVALHVGIVVVATVAFVGHRAVALWDKLGDGIGGTGVAQYFAVQASACACGTALVAAGVSMGLQAEGLGAVGVCSMVAAALGQMGARLTAAEEGGAWRRITAVAAMVGCVVAVVVGLSVLGEVGRKAIVE